MQIIIVVKIKGSEGKESGWRIFEACCFSFPAFRLSSISFLFILIFFRIHMDAPTFLSSNAETLPESKSITALPFPAILEHNPES